MLLVRPCWSASLLYLRRRLAEQLLLLLLLFSHSRACSFFRCSPLLVTDISPVFSCSQSLSFTLNISYSSPTCCFFLSDCFGGGGGWGHATRPPSVARAFCTHRATCGAKNVTSGTFRNMSATLQNCRKPCT